jgi:SPP1 gp7 family putative phage head morphogenesis protein
MALTRAQEVALEVRHRRGLHKLVHGRHAPARKRLPRQLQPDHIRRAYYGTLRSTVLRSMLELVRRKIVPALPRLVERYAHLHADAEEEDLNALMGSVEETFDEQWSNQNFAAVAQPVAIQTSEFQSEQLDRQIKAGLGVDVTRAEPWLTDVIRVFTQENVALIKSIPSEFFSDLEKRLARGISEGQRPEELEELIQERYGVSESRAALIARDQVGKFYGNLNERRQTALGITGYVWRGALDERERPEHLAREGEAFEWNEPPEDGNPGEPIQCRCYGEPDLGPILEEL